MRMQRSANSFATRVASVHQLPCESLEVGLVAHQWRRCRGTHYIVALHNGVDEFDAGVHILLRVLGNSNPVEATLEVC